MRCGECAIEQTLSVYLQCRGQHCWNMGVWLCDGPRSTFGTAVLLSRGLHPQAVQLHICSTACLVDQRVFRDLMSEKLPRLHAHFEQYKVDYTLITFNWFLVVFVDSVVSDILFKIWDSFLYEGPKALGAVACSLSLSLTTCQTAGGAARSYGGGDGGLES
ncbi:hypothetical protein P7K49_017380 [Saguinus oedipus]|uniref:Rab-GAP TBC domain-containing protein n=1 Tax=Saguinus oedipus TaxID=9490 RepID=A0ABQ9V3G5_SAGOE|nr:hypothetical protein P7K49_017380 [Saguinus oedipus]